MTLRPILDQIFHDLYQEVPDHFRTCAAVCLSSASLRKPNDLKSFLLEFSGLPESELIGDAMSFDQWYTEMQGMLPTYIHRLHAWLVEVETDLTASGLTEASRQKIIANDLQTALLAITQKV